MTCHHCGDDPHLDVEEFSILDRWFTLSGCCQQNVEDWIREIPTTPRRKFSKWFESKTGFYIRAIVANEQVMRLDFGVDLGPISLKDAKNFVREHHRHNKPPCGWRFGFGCFNGEELIGVCMVGRPVARMLDHTKILEVNRVCVKETYPQGLGWNACSLLYAAAAREGKRRGFEKIITYTLESETASSVRAAGWKEETKTRGGSWNRKSRKRKDKAPTCPKVRWSKKLLQS